MNYHLAAGHAFTVRTKSGNEYRITNRVHERAVATAGGRRIRIANITHIRMPHIRQTKKGPRLAFRWTPIGKALVKL